VYCTICNCRYNYTLKCRRERSTLLEIYRLTKHGIPELKLITNYNQVNVKMGEKQFWVTELHAQHIWHEQKHISIFWHMNSLFRPHLLLCRSLNLCYFRLTWDRYFSVLSKYTKGMHYRSSVCNKLLVRQK